MNPKAGCAGSVLNILQVERFNHQTEIEHGILDNPRPDAAMAYHMMIGKNQVGTYMYNAGVIMMNLK